MPDETQRDFYLSFPPCFFTLPFPLLPMTQEQNHAFVRAHSGYKALPSTLSQILNLMAAL